MNQNICQAERDVNVTDVSVKCSYFKITANAPWCSEQNYRGAIESGLYRLKPQQVRVPRTLIINRLLPFQWNGRSNRRQAGEVLLISTMVAAVMAIVRLLLVMSGDVEENPGPVAQGERKKSLLKL